MKQNRKITDQEVEVIRTTLERASVETVNVAASTIESLIVISQCDCGCVSVDFQSPPLDELSKPIADGIGLTPKGGEVGIIVWGRNGQITGLEVYDIGAGENDLVLPVTDSIKPWEKKFQDNQIEGENRENNH
ncbi:MAG: hypothetical protein J0665_02860 [Deltaproteobacteria bacterium]|nr:hypothetical protein [Deltaproteobacteria bacterium]